MFFQYLTKFMKIHKIQVFIGEKSFNLVKIVKSQNNELVAFLKRCNI